MTCPFSRPRHLFHDLASARAREVFEYSDKLSGYVVSRYDDIVSVLDRPDSFSSRPAVPEFPPPVKSIFADKVPEKGTLLAWDNPDHDRLRKSVASFFVPRRLKRFEPLLRTTAHELIDGFVARGSIEIKRNFALPLPLRTIVAVAGLDPARWQWIGRCLALFGGITETGGEVSVEQKVRDVLDLHDYIAGVIKERRTNRKDDLISHIWNERDAGTVTMTDFEHLGMIPGLLLAGHETTTNVLSMGLSHLLANDLWEEASQNDETRAAAIEELLRYESAITGMPRMVVEEAKVGSTTFQPGDMLFLAYNSGSRDISRFDAADRLDLDRRSKMQHLGFGRGIHACLGAPFARMLLRIELSVLWERLPGLRLKTPYSQIQYLPVQAGRGPEAVEVAWDPPTQEQMMNRQVVAVPAKIPGGRPRHIDLAMYVVCAELVTRNIILITLRPLDGGAPLDWSPGAHIDVAVGSMGHRQYSICSDPSDRASIQIAVLKEDAGTGGSRYLHANAIANGKLSIRAPRNNFAFKAGSRKSVFVAGGIGITPLKPMALAAASAGLDYQIIYLGKSRSGMAFVHELAAIHRGRMLVWATDEHDGKRFDLDRFVQNEQLEGLKIYSCGPEALLAGLENALRNAPPDTLRVERFANLVVSTTAQNSKFDVVLGRSGKVLMVPEDRTLLEVINDAGLGILSTCNKGLCGTCEVGVLEGIPEHRDAVLTAAERAESASIMTCVSRCRGKRLVLDL